MQHRMYISVYILFFPFSEAMVYLVSYFILYDKLEVFIPLNKFKMSHDYDLTHKVATFMFIKSHNPDLSYKCHLQLSLENLDWKKMFP